MAEDTCIFPLPQAGEGLRVAAMTRRCEASGAGMAASHPLPQTAGFASNVSRDVRVSEQTLRFRALIDPHPQPFPRLRGKGAYCMV